MKKNKAILINAIAIVITAVYLFPLYWMITTSIKSYTEVFATPPTLFPHTITFSAYTEQLTGEDIGIPTYFLNSMVISTSTTLLTLLLAVPASYGLARFKIKGAKIILLSILVTQMLPNSLLLTPLFIIFKHLGILDTYMSAILADATITIPFAVLILRPYYLSTPLELEDSARIDGCGRLGVFLRIIMPISYPGIIIICAFAFLMAWGNLMYALTFISNGALRPLPLTIYKAMGQYGTRWNNLMAYSSIVAIPVLIMFIFLQRYLISGLTAGSVKE